MAGERESEAMRLLAAYEALRGTGGWVYRVSPWGVPTAYDTSEGVLYRAELDDNGHIAGVSITMPTDRIGARLNTADALVGLQSLIAAGKASAATHSGSPIADRLSDAMAPTVAAIADGVSNALAPSITAIGDMFSGAPSSAAVADMLAVGMGRADIAKRYGRSVRTVDDWISKARRQFPDRVPPVRRGRPRTKTSGPDGSDSPPTEGSNE